MENNIQETFTKEEYNFLKTHTTLGPIALLKLAKYKEFLEDIRLKYYQWEGEYLDFDWDKLNDYECKLRFEAWKRECSILWHINSEDMSLTDYAKISMIRQMEWDKRILRKKKRNN